MARPLNAPLAPGIQLTGGYVVNLIAVDPTTGNAVSGVVVSNVSMQVDAAEQDTFVEPLAVVEPLFTYGSNV